MRSTRYWRSYLWTSAQCIGAWAADFAGRAVDAFRTAWLVLCGLALLPFAVGAGIVLAIALVPFLLEIATFGRAESRPLYELGETSHDGEW